MIDFDREEFLQRFDVRLAFLSNLMQTNENYIISMTPVDKSKYEELLKQNKKYHSDLIDWITQKDREVRESFEKMKAEIAKENCDNE